MPSLTHIYNGVVIQYPIVCIESLSESPLESESLDIFLQVLKDTLEVI